MCVGLTVLKASAVSHSDDDEGFTKLRALVRVSVASCRAVVLHPESDPHLEPWLHILFPDPCGMMISACR